MSNWKELSEKWKSSLQSTVHSPLSIVPGLRTICDWYRLFRDQPCTDSAQARQSRRTNNGLRPSVSLSQVGVGRIKFPILVFFFLLPTAISSDCDPSRPGFRGFSFVTPHIVDPINVSAPFILQFEALYDRFLREEERRVEDNVAEWRERYCNRPRAEDIAFLIYKTSIPQLEQMRTAIASPSIPLDPVLSQNTFARHIERNKCTETLEYLIYAKRCEPYVVARSSWENGRRDTGAMQQLIEEGLSRFLNIQSHYIRLRYAYQMIRLAHYAGLYERTLELYDYLLPKTDNDPSLIEYWIEGHRAGALLALGAKVQASYIYSLIFQHCPSRREAALLSFRIDSDEEWKQCLLLCRDDRERATLYAMRAYARHSRAVEEMRMIHALDPTNRNLELLLVKEIVELEKDLLGLEFNRYRSANRRYYDRPRDGAGEQVIELQHFVHQVLQEGLVPRREVWALAEGYLQLLAGDYYSAARTFEEVKDQVTEKELRRQLEVFELVLRISAWTEVSDAVETEADRIVRRSDQYEEYEDFARFLDDKLNYLYRSNDHPGKVFITRYPVEALRPNPQQRIIEDLLGICRKENPTRLERRMIEQADGSTIENELLDMKATLLFGDYQLEAALETLKEMERSEWDRFGRFNPFAERINDCVHCPVPGNLPTYNRGELIERLLELEYEARADPARAAAYYYRLGVAFYNMTYFSYEWEAMDYYRSGASLQARYLRDGDNVSPHSYYPYGNTEHFDCSRALFYFQRARSIARDPELAARASFWAAKCERNEYYASRFQDVARSYTYFNDLTENFNGTEYYQRIINQCLTFLAYANR